MKREPEPLVPVVPKHHPMVRLTHWLHVPLLLGLIASGLAIYWASPVFQHAPNPKTGSHEYLQDAGLAVSHVVPTSGDPAKWIYDHLSLGTRQLALALRWHWALAYLYMVCGVLYVLGLIGGGGWRALLPRLTDARDAGLMMRYYAGLAPSAIARRPWPHPEVQGKYNALQRGAYFVVVVCGALAVASGWAMHKPAQLGWLERLFGSYDNARIVHFVCMVVLGGFVIPHVILAMADGWDTVRSMIVGWSKRVRGGEHERA